MGLRLKIKMLICDAIIIKEWIENGEFDKADKVVVISTSLQAMIVNFLFRKSGKNIKHYTVLNEKEMGIEKTKWIIFDNNLKNLLPQDDYNILWMPKL